MRYTIKVNRNYETLETLNLPDAGLFARVKHPHAKDLEVFPSRWAKTHSDCTLSLEEENMLLNNGFEDTSWKNDECASFQKKVFPYNKKSELVVNLWVDSSNPSERFEPDGDRFILQLKDNDMSQYIGTAYLPVDVRDAINVANKIIKDYTDKDAEKTVLLDLIEVEIKKHYKDGYAGTEEAIAISNMLHLYMEKLDLWNDEKSDIWNLDDDAERLDRFEEIIKEEYSR